MNCGHKLDTIPWHVQIQWSDPFFIVNIRSGRRQKKFPPKKARLFNKKYVFQADKQKNSKS